MFNTCVDSDIILCTTVNTAMLEVYYVTAASYFFKILSVELYSSKNAWSSKNLGMRMVTFTHLTRFCSQKVYLQHGGMLWQ